MTFFHEVIAILRRRASAAYASSVDERLSRDARTFYHALGEELEQAIEEIKKITRNDSQSGTD
jgi:hypothetical protein